MKPKQVRLYLNEECQDMFADLTKAVPDLPESQLTTLMLTSALRALRARHYQITLPLRFRVADEDPVTVPSTRIR